MGGLPVHSIVLRPVSVKPAPRFTPDIQRTSVTLLMFAEVAADTSPTLVLLSTRLSSVMLVSVRPPCCEARVRRKRSVIGTFGVGVVLRSSVAVRLTLFTGSGPIVNVTRLTPSKVRVNGTG